jgi:HK97 family phage major capsid protein
MSQIYTHLLAQFPGGKAIAKLHTKMEKNMPGIQELREKRTTLVAEMQSMVATKGSGKWSAAATQKFNQLESEVAATDESIDLYQRALDAAGERLKSGSTPGATVATAGGDNTPALRNLGRFMATGQPSDLSVYGAMTESGDGAVVVPAEIAAIIMSQVQKLSPIRQAATVVSITTAHSKYTVPFSPTGAGTSWVGESDARSESTAPGLVGVEFPDAECAALVSCSAWWEQDSLAGAAWLTQEIAKAFARAEGAAFISGTGIKQPRGILTAAVSDNPDETRTYGQLQAINSGDAATIKADGLIDLQYSLKPEYRAGAVWLMNSATLAVVRKLKDSTGAFLWQPSLAPGQPQTLLGSPVIECGDWPDIAADAYPVAYGDMKSAYTIVDRSLTLLRDPFTARPFVLFDARKRVSGNLVDTAALKLLKIAA